MGLISNNLGRYPVKQPFQVTIFNIPKYALFKNERKNIEMIRLFYAKVLKGLRKISQQIWGNIYETIKRNHRMCSIFTGKQLCWSLLLIKLQAFIKKRFQHKCFPLNIAKYL